MIINDLKLEILKAAQDVRSANNLAGSITNGVTTDFVANAQLAVGGSAAMVYLPDEAEFLAEAGGALYINMGTLMPISGETITRAAKRAYEVGTPWVLDPVAIGIGELRTKTLVDIAKYKPAIVRGNASEIIALANLWGALADVDGGTRGKGVDSTDSVESAKSAAIALAKFTGGAVAISGEVDLITDGAMIAASTGGCHLMEKVTGFGCSLAGVMAVYAASTTPFVAALASANLYNLAGQAAFREGIGTATFKVAFLDELSLATPEAISEHLFALDAI